jgi:hypothetical protein
VKSGRRSLLAAQKGIAADWTQYLSQAAVECGSKKCVNGNRGCTVPPWNSISKKYSFKASPFG